MVQTVHCFFMGGDGMHQGLLSLSLSMMFQNSVFSYPHNLRQKIPSDHSICNSKSSKIHSWCEQRSLSISRNHGFYCFTMVYSYQILKFQPFSTIPDYQGPPRCGKPPPAPWPWPNGSKPGWPELGEVFPVKLWSWEESRENPRENHWKITGQSLEKSLERSWKLRKLYDTSNPLEK